MNVRVNLDVDKILQERGLGQANSFRVFLAENIKRRAEPYVPMQQGILKSSARVSTDGRTLTYNQPYARYQWEGKVMRDSGGRAYYGKAPKHTTDEDLHYDGSGLRGKKWVDRMMIDQKDEIIQDCEALLGGAVE